MVPFILTAPKLSSSSYPSSLFSSFITINHFHHPCDPNHFLISPFLHSSPLRIQKSLLGRSQYQVTVVQNSTTSDVQPGPIASLEVFGEEKELSAIQSIVDRLSPPARLAISIIVLAGTIFAGYSLGIRFGKSKNAALGGAIALGLAGGGAVYALNSCVPEVASINLHNYVAGCDHPNSVKNEHIEMIAKRYGVNKQDGAFNAELCDLYSRFVSSVLPPEGDDLKGNEVDIIVKFKNALGIDDPDAAATHIEIGRRIFRQRLETGDRDADIKQRQAFQRLIYVSSLVFGEASSFLLPWKRVFKVSDSQVEVAIRDNAQRLYAYKLKSVGKDINEEQLVSLREAQLQYQLSDELSANMFREHIRTMLETNISTALSVLKSRTTAVKGASRTIEELNKILAFNGLLFSLENHPNADKFARGLSPVSLHDGEYDSDRKMDDLKFLYRAYIVESLSSEYLEDDKLAALNELKNIFGLGKREAETIRIDVTSKVYRKRLAKSVSSGDLEASESKAAYLQNLCEKLRFNPEIASEIHHEIYRQKLEQLVGDGELGEDDVAALLRLRVLLCIPQQTVEAAHADICGCLFEKVVKEAISAGVDGYDADIKKSVRKAAHGLRLTRVAAMSVASKAVCEIFINYIKRSRAANNRTESAKELKKMIAFNRLVVTELVSDIKGDSDSDSDSDFVSDKIPETIAHAHDHDEWESLQTLQKIKTAIQTGTDKPAQTLINLKDALPARDRSDIYQTYLLHCLTGEVARIPFGAQITLKKDDSEYGFLNQLGSILGLTHVEIVAVHRSLAEQAFRKQAEVVLADGQLSKGRIEQLSEIQKQVGLPPEFAQKAIKTITTTKMGAAIESAIARGRLDVKQIRELKEAGVELDNLIARNLRENLFKKTVEEIFSSGTGEFDEEDVYDRIPSDLTIDPGKARDVVKEVARARSSNSFIQAVSLLRQKNRSGVICSLNDLLACDKAAACGGLTWELSEEVAGLFGIYAKCGAAPEKVTRLQHLLGVDDSTAAALRESELQEAGEAVAMDEEHFVF